MRKLFTILVLLPMMGFTQANVDWYNYPGGVSIATDDSNNVYTANWDYSPAGDITLTKRDSTGSILWEVSYNNTDQTRHEVATWVETDNNGNILVSGTIRSGFSNPVNVSSLLMKFDPSGNLLWRVVYETDFDGSSTKKCIIDAQNNIYVLGTGNDGTAVVSKVKKISSDGIALWSYLDNAGIGLPVNIKFTPDDQVLIVGRAPYGSINGYAKITKDGTHVWSYPGVNSLTIGDAAGDAEGNSYLVHGEYVNNGGTVIKKVSPAGSLVWENTYALTAFRVEVGSDNMPVACGFPNTGSGGSSFIKVDGSGGIVWVNNDADGPLNLLMHAQLKMDDSDNIYLAAGTIFEMAICKVNSDGSSAWTATMPGSYAYCFDIGSDNNVYVVGGTTGRIVQYPQITNEVEFNIQEDITNVFPNPFNSEVNIAFTLQDPQYVRIWIIDSKGQVVDELENSLLLSGSWNYQWSPLDKHDISRNGTYFLNIIKGQKVETKKLLFIY
jgi:hypothetical protein